MPLDEQSKYLDIFSGNVGNSVNFKSSLSLKAIIEKKEYSIKYNYFNKVSTFGGVSDKIIFSNPIDFNTGNTRLHIDGDIFFTH